MTQAVSCDRCGTPVPDTAYVCDRCSGQLAQVLSEAAGIVEDAVATAARQARYGTGGRAEDGQLPYNAVAAEAVMVAGNILTTWARHAAETRGTAPGRPQAMAGPLCRAGLGCRHVTCQAIRSHYVPHPVTRAARWLVTQLEWLRHRREAAEAFVELADACALLRRTADRPPAHWYAGPCLEQLAEEPYQCQEDLYALPGAKTVRCRGCGFVHDAAGRKQWLLKEARAALAPAALIARAVSTLDLALTPAQIRGWAHRGRLLDRGHDGQGHPLYRVGDVIELAEEAAARAATRQDQAAA
jgi:hypothetical protein